MDTFETYNSFKLNCWPKTLFKAYGKIEKMSIQIKPLQQFFHMVLFI